MEIHLKQQQIQSFGKMYGHDLFEKAAEWDKDKYSG